MQIRVDFSSDVLCMGVLCSSVCVCVCVFFCVPQCVQVAGMGEPVVRSASAPTTAPATPSMAPASVSLAG